MPESGYRNKAGMKGVIKVRKSAERGNTNNYWLDSRHSFSFADYHDTGHMGFGTLRVINEDFVAPGAGFPTHGHQDMEIITYILEGALEHKDSMGNGATILPGDVQRMSAGTGIRHSEYNPSEKNQVHLLQIWILPEKRGISPSYAQKNFPPQDGLTLVVSKDGRDGSVTMNQNADVYRALLKPGEEIKFSPEKLCWIQAAKGEASVNGTALKAGDGAAIENEKTLKIIGKSAAELLIFDLK